MSSAPASPFPADALAANQAGTLTDAQRQLYKANDRSFRKSELYLAIGAIIVGLLLITSTGPSANAAFRPLVALACVVIAAILLFRALLAPDAMTTDLAKGTVESLEGAILKRTVSTNARGSSSTSHYLDVAGKEFRVGPRFYEAAPQAGWVKVYYLPRSRTLVNLEQLPDHELPAGALDSPTGMVQATVAAMKGGDRTAQAEALATMGVLRKSFEEGELPGGTQAPAAQPGQPTIAEAIIGTWRAGPISLTFAADGTLSSDLGGRGQQSQWSIDPAGQLHAQVAGRDLAGEAWVSGSTLTIKADGEARAFQRVGG